MDGPQDLGGKESFGPIDTTSPEFREDWERRQWALSKLVPVPGITIDWFRHALETMPPSVYLSVPYFQKWNVNLMALAVDAGFFSAEEVTTGKAASPVEPAQVQTVDELEAVQRGLNASFEAEAPAPPRFTVGDPVRTDARPSPGHTRLPAYARAADGHIVAHHGAHLYPDAGAQGDHLAHHLYTVEFRAADLWPDAEAPDDVICIDLWEPYLADA